MVLLVELRITQLTRGATSGDLELTALGTSGSVIIELRKDGSFTA